MKAALAAIALIAIFANAFALSASFTGEKHVTLCTCDSAVIPVAVTNDGRTDQDVSFESRDSTGLQATAVGGRFTVPAGQTVVHDVYIAAACQAKPGYASLAAKATDASSGETAPEAGVIEVAQCHLLSLRLDQSAFACGDSEYDFTLYNNGLEDEKGTLSTNLLDSEYTLSEREFSVPAGKTAGVVVHAKVDDASRGATLVLTANSQHATASATAVLEKTYCANGGGGNGNGGNGSGNNGGGNGLFGPLSGFFTLALSNPEWALLVLALLLIAFFYYTVHQLEAEEADYERRTLAR